MQITVTPARMSELMPQTPAIFSTRQSRRLAKAPSEEHIILRSDARDDAEVLIDELRAAFPKDCKAIELPAYQDVYSINVYPYFDHKDAMIHGTNLLKWTLKEISDQNRIRRAKIQTIAETWKSNNHDIFNDPLSREALRANGLQNYGDELLDDALECLDKLKILDACSLMAEPQAILSPKNTQVATKAVQGSPCANVSGPSPQVSPSQEHYHSVPETTNNTPQIRPDTSSQLNTSADSFQTITGTSIPELSDREPLAHLSNPNHQDQIQRQFLGHASQAEFQTWHKSNDAFPEESGFAICTQQPRDHHQRSFPSAGNAPAGSQYQYSRDKDHRKKSGSRRGSYNSRQHEIRRQETTSVMHGGPQKDREDRAHPKQTSESTNFSYSTSNYQQPGTSGYLPQPPLVGPVPIHAFPAGPNMWHASGQPSPQSHMIPFTLGPDGMPLGYPATNAPRLLESRQPYPILPGYTHHFHTGPHVPNALQVPKTRLHHQDHGYHIQMAQLDGNFESGPIYAKYPPPPHFLLSYNSNPSTVSNLRKKIWTDDARLTESRDCTVSQNPGASSQSIQEFYDRGANENGRRSQFQTCNNFLSKGDSHTLMQGVRGQKFKGHREYAGYGVSGKSARIEDRNQRKPEFDLEGFHDLSNKANGQIENEIVKPNLGYSSNKQSSSSIKQVIQQADLPTSQFRSSSASSRSFGSGGPFYTEDDLTKLHVAGDFTNGSLMKDIRCLPGLIELSSIKSSLFKENRRSDQRRGFVFAKFENERCALDARSILNRMDKGNFRCIVSFAFRRVQKHWSSDQYGPDIDDPREANEARATRAARSQSLQSSSDDPSRASKKKQDRSKNDRDGRIPSARSKGSTHSSVSGTSANASRSPHTPMSRSHDQLNQSIDSQTKVSITDDDHSSKQDRRGSATPNHDKDLESRLHLQATDDEAERSKGLLVNDASSFNPDLQSDGGAAERIANLGSVSQLNGYSDGSPKRKLRNRPGSLSTISAAKCRTEVSKSNKRRHKSAVIETRQGSKDVVLQNLTIESPEPGMTKQNEFGLRAGEICHALPDREQKWMQLTGEEDLKSHTRSKSAPDSKGLPPLAQACIVREAGVSSKENEKGSAEPTNKAAESAGKWPSKVSKILAETKTPPQIFSNEAFPSLTQAYKLSNTEVTPKPSRKSRPVDLGAQKHADGPMTQLTNSMSTTNETHLPKRSQGKPKTSLTNLFKTSLSDSNTVCNDGAAEVRSPHSSVESADNASNKKEKLMSANVEDPDHSVCQTNSNPAEDFSKAICMTPPASVKARNAKNVNNKLLIAQKTEESGLANERNCTASAISTKIDSSTTRKPQLSEWTVIKPRISSTKQSSPFPKRQLSERKEIPFPGQVSNMSPKTDGALTSLISTGPQKYENPSEVVNHSESKGVGGDELAAGNLQSQERSKRKASSPKTSEEAGFVPVEPQTRKKKVDESPRPRTPEVSAEAISTHKKKKKKKRLANIDVNKAKLPLRNNKASCGGSQASSGSSMPFSTPQELPFQNQYQLLLSERVDAEKPPGTPYALKFSALESEDLSKTLPGFEPFTISAKPRQTSSSSDQTAEGTPTEFGSSADSYKMPNSIEMEVSSEASSPGGSSTSDTCSTPNERPVFGEFGIKYYRKKAGYLQELSSIEDADPNTEAEPTVQKGSLTSSAACVFGSTYLTDTPYWNRLETEEAVPKNDEKKGAEVDRPAQQESAERALMEKTADGLARKTTHEDKLRQTGYIPAEEVPGGILGGEGIDSKSVVWIKATDGKRKARTSRSKEKAGSSDSALTKGKFKESLASSKGSENSNCTGISKVKESSPSKMLSSSASTSSSDTEPRLPAASTELKDIDGKELAKLHHCVQNSAANILGSLKNPGAPALGSSSMGSSRVFIPRVIPGIGKTSDVAEKDPTSFLLGLKMSPLSIDFALTKPSSLGAQGNNALTNNETKHLADSTKLSNGEIPINSSWTEAQKIKGLAENLVSRNDILRASNHSEKADNQTTAFPPLNRQSSSIPATENSISGSGSSSSPSRAYAEVVAAGTSITGADCGSKQTRGSRTNSQIKTDIPANSGAHCKFGRKISALAFPTKVKGSAEDAAWALPKGKRVWKASSTSITAAQPLTGKENQRP